MFGLRLRRAAARRTPVDSLLRFAEVVAANATRVAVRCGAEQLSYGELDALSDAIANGLTACMPGGARIGLSMQKSVSLVASVLGVLKAGCAYVPLDPAYPAERLRYFVENCSVDTVLADETSRRALEAAGLGELRMLDPAQVAKGQPKASTQGARDTQAGVGVRAETDVEKADAQKQAGKQWAAAPAASCRPRGARLCDPHVGLDRQAEGGTGRTP